MVVLAVEEWTSTPQQIPQGSVGVCLNSPRVLYRAQLVGFGLCFLKIMWFCWLHQVVIFDSGLVHE